MANINLGTTDTLDKPAPTTGQQAQMRTRLGLGTAAVEAATAFATAAQGAKADTALQMGHDKLPGSVRMTSVKTSGDISLYVTSTTGYVRYQKWDGAFATVEDGSLILAVGAWGYTEKDLMIWPCNENGFLNGELTYIACDNFSVSDISSVDITGLSSLEFFSCWGVLRRLDLTGCTAIEVLSIGDNCLLELDLSGLENLELLELFNNKMTTETVDACFNSLPVSAESNAGFWDISGNAAPSSASATKRAAMDPTWNIVTD